MERRSNVHLATSSSSKLSRVLLSSFYPPITQNVSSLPITSLLDSRACAAFPHLYPSVSRLFAQICIPSYRVGNASISSPLAFVDGFATMNVMPSANPASWFFSKHTAHASWRAECDDMPNRGDGLICETDPIERVLDCRLHQAPMMEANAIVLLTQMESVEDPTSFLSCVVLLRVVRYSTLEGPTAVSKKNAGWRRRGFRKSLRLE